jgi:hypothetical protein
MQSLNDDLYVIVIVTDTCTLFILERWTEETGCQTRRTLHSLQVRELQGIVFSR